LPAALFLDITPKKSRRAGLGLASPARQSKENDMSDRVSASISIGGILPRSLHHEFIDIIQSEGLRTDWDGPEFTPEDLIEGKPLDLMAYDVAWGMFDTLEQYCVDHSLAYRRSSDGFSGSFGAERIVFDGVNGPYNYDTNDDDMVVLLQATIDHLGSMEAIAAYIADAEVTVPPLLFSAG
jgi:hypothetical protein